MPCAVRSPTNRRGQADARVHGDQQWLQGCGRRAQPNPCRSGGTSSASSHPPALLPPRPASAHTARLAASPEPNHLSPKSSALDHRTALANAPRPAGVREDLDIDVLAELVSAYTDGIVILRADHQLVYANPAACKLLGYPFDEVLGRDFLAFFAERDRQTTMAFFARARRGRPRTVAAVAYRPDGTDRDVEVTIIRLHAKNRPFIAVTFRDMSERHRRLREAATLAQAAASLGGSDSTSAIVQTIAAGALTGTRALATFLTLDDEDDVAAWIGIAGLPDGVRDRVREVARGCACSPIFLRSLMAQPVVVYADARRLMERAPETAGLAAALASLPWQAAVFAPLLYRGAIIGVLTAIYPQGQLPCEAETAFLAALTDQATMAAANARLVVAAREAVALEERRRLARDLHDSVSQALYGIELEARVARERLDTDPARAAQPIDHVLRLVEAGQAELRALIFELRPESLETEGLVANLNRQIEAVRSRHGIEAETIATEEPEAPVDVKLALYPIAKEAIQNAVRHARARRVDVDVETDGDTVVVQIADDGVGFDPEGTTPGHLGLRSMRERALAAGGSIEVASQRGRGTRIVVRVPSASSGPEHRPDAVRQA